MIKIPKFDIKNLKKMGEDLVDSVSSTAGLKSTDKEALPGEIKESMEALEKHLAEFIEAQKAMTAAAEALKKDSQTVGQATLTLCKPEEKAEKPAEEPKAEKAEEKQTKEEPKEEEKPAEEEKTEEKPAEEIPKEEEKSE